MGVILILINETEIFNSYDGSSSFFYTKGDSHGLQDKYEFSNDISFA